MRIQDQEVNKLRELLKATAIEMTSELKGDPDWVDVLHPEAHDIVEFLRELHWFRELVTLHPEHKESIVEECRMQIETLDEVTSVSLEQLNDSYPQLSGSEKRAYLFAVADRENSCLVDARDRMCNYQWYPNVDIEDYAYEMVQNLVVDDLVLDYIDFERVEYDLRNYDGYSEHDGGILRRTN